MMGQIPVMQNLQYKKLLCLFWEIKFQNTLDSGFMQRFYHITKFFDGIFRCTVRRLRSKIISFCIPPVICFHLIFHLHCIFQRHIFRKDYLFKIIHRHQFQRSDTQFLKIRNFFDDSTEGTFFAHFGIFLHCIATHMQFIQNCI